MERTQTWCKKYMRNKTRNAKWNILFLIFLEIECDRLIALNGLVVEMAKSVPVICCYFDNTSSFSTIIFTCGDHIRIRRIALKFELVIFSMYLYI